MNISLLDSATVPHGSAFWARGMAEQLARRGHRVTLFCPPRSPLREPPPASGATLRAVPLRSNYDLLSVAALPWVGPDRVSLIYNGIDLERFQPTGCRDLRQECGIADGMPVAAVVARLQALKGHEDLLRCLPAVWDRFPDLHLLLAGQGP